jgi:hypothetical protein
VCARGNVGLAQTLFQYAYEASERVDVEARISAADALLKVGDHVAVLTEYKALLDFARQSPNTISPRDAR